MDFLTPREQRGKWSATALRIIALVLPCAGAARAQSVLDSVRTANGFCHIWQAPPGSSSPSDLSYSRCAIDRQPRRLSGPDIPAPTLGVWTGGSIFIAVRADGTVDSASTRPYSQTGDTSFDHHAVEAVREWRFEPLRNGVPVRAGLELEVASAARNDTMPGHFVWRYADGPERDTAYARWVSDTTRPPPLTETQTDSVHAAVIRQLVRLQVLLVGSQRYCLATPSADALAARRLDSVARITFRRGGPLMAASLGCERDPTFLQLSMPPVYRTERDRVVLFPRGDSLPAWPWGLDAKSWRAWSGRCVGRMFADGHAAMACGVKPVASMAEMARTLRSVPRSPNGQPWAAGDSVRFTILATRSGAFLVDTLHFAVAQLPILEPHTDIEARARSAEPVAVVRVPELRHETRLGVFDELRILIDHGPPDVTLFVSYRAGARPPFGGSTARHTAEGRWDFSINFDGGRPDAEYWVYMFRRAATLPPRAPGS